MSASICTHHNDQQRIECSVCLVAALTAERDQLRSDCDDETKWAAHYIAQSIAEKARADKAEAVLSDPQQLHAHCLRNLNEGQIAHLFGERMTEIVNRAEKAEVELNLWQEGCIVREEDRAELKDARRIIDEQSTLRLTAEGSLAHLTVCNSEIHKRHQAELYDTCSRALALACSLTEAQAELATEREKVRRLRTACKHVDYLPRIQSALAATKDAK